VVVAAVCAGIDRGTVTSDVVGSTDAVVGRVDVAELLVGAASGTARRTDAFAETGDAAWPEHAASDDATTAAVRARRIVS